MKRIIFILLFSLVSTPTFAQETQEMTSDYCESTLGGECNIGGSMSCGVNQNVVGQCMGLAGTLNWGACCKMKDNGPVDLSYRGLDPNEADQSSVPIIGKTKCEAPKTNGGWGGACKVAEILSDDGCSDSGNDEEDFVGLCDPPGVVERATHCCVAKGTAIKNPTPDKFETLGMTEAVCESSTYGGKCEDIDSNGWDPTGGFIDGKEPTCDTSGEVVVGLCRDSVTGSFDNGCCVPQDGAYCKKLKEDNGGNDVCATGVGGSVIPLEYGDYQLLEQIPGSSNTSGELQPYLESIYKAGFVLIVIGAIFMIGFGGFTYMASAGNTSMIKKGKGMITDAIIGLVVALLIWLILNIINPDLVNLKIDPLPGVSFDPAGTGANTAEQNSSNSGGGATGTFAAKLYSGSSLFTDAQSRDYLSKNSVGVNKSDCASSTDTNCTSLGSFPGAMAGVAASIKSNCNCEVTITGGTEAGHSTHGKGRAAMDIRKTSALDSFFSRQPKVGSSSGNPIYQYGKVKVWFEDNQHYHIWEPAN